MFDTEFYENQSRSLNIRQIWIFFYRDIFIVKPKSSNVLPQRNDFVKSLRKQYGNPDSHPIFLIVAISYSLLAENRYYLSSAISVLVKRVAVGLTARLLGPSVT